MSRFARILALGWLALGCGGPPGAVRADVQSYFARMRSWGPVEAETERTIERMMEQSLGADITQKLLRR